ncbi:MAG: hypothetical protein JW829_02720 [Pirellulales bacterium]|nr:hypothetical protein [Pirellulales bacterium]
MEQIRAILQFFKKQHFWLLNALIIVTAIVSWFLAARSLNDTFSKNRNTIETALKAQQQIAATNPHHNDKTIEAQRQEVAQLRMHTLEVWQKLYKRQQEEVLKWPAQLGNAFINMISKYKFGDELTAVDKPYLARYRNYIQDAARKLPEIVQAKTKDVDMSLGGELYGERGGYGQQTPGGPEDAAVEEDYVVLWPSYQEQIEGRLVWSQTPTSMQMWIAQEDLWVIETMLRAIAAVNRDTGATGYHDAAIREIHSLEIGREAAMARNTQGRLFQKRSSQGPGMPSEGGGYGRGMEGGGYEGRSLQDLGRGAEGGIGRAMPGMEGRGDPYGYGAGGETSGSEDGSTMDANAWLLQGRYLDAEGKPSDGTEESGNMGYKKLPVRMVLTMDQRMLSKLVIECANAPLPIEVEEIRANVGSAQEMGSSGASGYGEGGGSRRGGYGESGYGGYGPGRGGIMRGNEGGGGRSLPMGGSEGGGIYGRGGNAMEGYGMDDAEEIDMKPNPQMIPVILYGTIYIYNPPNPEAMKFPWEEGGATDSNQPFAGQTQSSNYSS